MRGILLFHSSGISSGTPSPLGKLAFVIEKTMDIFHEDYSSPLSTKTIGLTDLHQSQETGEVFRDKDHENMGVPCKIETPKFLFLRLVYTPTPAIY